MPGGHEKPDWLNDEAKAEWDRIVPQLQAMGLLASIDRSALASYCTVWSRWVSAEDYVRKFGSIVILAGRVEILIRQREQLLGHCY